MTITGYEMQKAFADEEVLGGVDRSIPRGGTVVVLGGPGSGKSVLLRHAIGLHQPDAGSVWVDDEDITGLSEEQMIEPRKKVGMLFQACALFDSMNAFDNVAFPLRTFTTKSVAEIRKEVEHCLEVVHLTGVGAMKPAELSGGMTKRVALARAIALRPRYRIHAEPPSGPDPQPPNTIDQWTNIILHKVS